MALFGANKVHAFGLDISDTTVKVAELTLVRGSLKSAVFADVPLMDKTITNHMIVSEERLAGNILKAIASARSIDTKFVVCSVPEAKSFVRVIQIPKIEESEIAGAIPYELEQDIPIPIDQVYLDWVVLEETVDKLHLLVTACSKDYIDSLVASLHIAKLIPVGMEIGSQATARALIGPDTMKKSVLIVDIGAKQTSFIIVDQSVPLYTSSMPVAGNNFTDSIARGMNIPWADAEKIKITKGLISQSEGEEGVRTAVLPILDSIIDETKNVIRFFEEHSESHHTIDTILLCGGSSQVPGVIDYISTRINLGSGKEQLNVIQGDPWSNVVSSLTKQATTAPMDRQKASGYSTSIGLALRGLSYETD